VTLNPKIQVELPSQGIIVRRSGPYPAVYKVLQTYRDQTGQPTNQRVNIGKFDSTTGMLIPNNKYWDFYEDHAGLVILSKPNSILDIGPAFLVGRIMSDIGLSASLEHILGSKRSGEVQTVLRFINLDLSFSNFLWRRPGRKRPDRP
jgi:hypothetical protein